LGLAVSNLALPLLTRFFLQLAPPVKITILIQGPSYDYTYLLHGTILFKVQLIISAFISTFINRPPSGAIIRKL